MELLQVANHLEQIGDIIETNLVTTGRRRIEEGVVISKATMEVIRHYFDEVSQAFKASIRSVREQDSKAAWQVKRMKKDMAALAEETARYELSRLVADEPNRLQTFTREMEMIETLSRIYRMSRKIARTQWLEAAEAEVPQAAE